MVLVGSSDKSGDTADYHAAGLANINSYVAVQTGTVRHITVSLISGGATQVVVGLYSDIGGSPGELLTSGTIPIPVFGGAGTDGAWNTADVSPYCVTAGTAYWIAILSPFGDGEVDFGYHFGVPASKWQHSPDSLPALQSPWVTGAMTGMNDTECSFYASP